MSFFRRLMADYVCSLADEEENTESEESVLQEEDTSQEGEK